MFDNGCTNHMTGDNSMFSYYYRMENSSETIVFGDNSKGEVLGLGNIAVTHEHSISKVLLVDLLSYNLLSVSKFYEMDYDCLFMDKGLIIYRMENSSIAFTGSFEGQVLTS